MTITIKIDEVTLEGITHISNFTEHQMVEEEPDVDENGVRWLVETPIRDV